MEFTKLIYEYCGKDTKVIPVTSEEYGSAAKRPAYSVLDNYKLKHEFGYEMAEWKQALKIYLEKRNLLKKEKGSSMKKKRVLVTGANGYIGRHGAGFIGTDMKYWLQISHLMELMKEQNVWKP